MEAAGRMRQNRLAGSKRAQRMRLVHRDHIPNLIGVLLAGEMNRKMLRNGRSSRCSTSRISCAGECCSHRQCRCQDGTVGRGGTQTIPVCRTRPLPDKSRFPTVQGKGRNSGKKFGQDRSVRTAPFTPRSPRVHLPVLLNPLQIQRRNLQRFQLMPRPQPTTDRLHAAPRQHPLATTKHHVKCQ